MSDDAPGRAPFDAAALARLSPRWAVTAVPQVGSTNADLLAALAAGTAGDGAVLVADLQQDGRGRRGRSWTAPFAAGLTFSVAVDVSAVAPARRGWCGVVVGLAVVEAIAAVTGRSAELKWPNDVLLAGAKLAGILAELAGSAVVVGCGINVSLTGAELPRPDATSLRLAGCGPVDRPVLLAAILTALAPRLDRWRAAAGDVDVAGVRAEYRRHCVTIGTRVRLELPGGRTVTGTAVDVAADGAIGIRGTTGTVTSYSAGDVVHLRAVADPAASRR